MALPIQHSGSTVRIAALAFVLCLATLPAQAQNESALLGGPKGVVKSAKGDLLEGIMVQLIAQKSAIRTTVYSNADGRYEFPKLEPGPYTLRIAQPREFHPYIKENVAIDGQTPLEEITLSRITSGELLPPSPEIAAQMTGSEWLASLSGTGDEKKLLTTTAIGAIPISRFSAIDTTKTAGARSSTA